MSAHHRASILILPFFGACWDYSVSPFHSRPNYESTPQYFVCHFFCSIIIVIPCFSRLPVIPSKFCSDSAPPSGSDVVLFEQSPHKASTELSIKQENCAVGRFSVRCQEKAVIVTQ
jgi:hypothetical protein